MNLGIGSGTRLGSQVLAEPRTVPKQPHAERAHRVPNGTDPNGGIELLSRSNAGNYMPSVSVTSLRTRLRKQWFAERLQTLANACLGGRHAAAENLPCRERPHRSNRPELGKVGSGAWGPLYQVFYDGEEPPKPLLPKRRNAENMLSIDSQ